MGPYSKDQVYLQHPVCRIYPSQKLEEQSSLVSRFIYNYSLNDNSSRLQNYEYIDLKISLNIQIRKSMVNDFWIMGLKKRILLLRFRVFSKSTTRRVFMGFILLISNFSCMLILSSKREKYRILFVDYYSERDDIHYNYIYSKHLNSHLNKIW